MFDLVDKYANRRECTDKTLEELPSELLKVLKGKHNEVQNTEPEGKALNMLKAISKCLKGSEDDNELCTQTTESDCIIKEANDNKVNKVKGSCTTSEDSKEKEIDRKKKLVSGRCARPDETDIKLVVKYAHEKLDPRHISIRDFDQLDFNTLIAGELEIALLEETPLCEATARIEIAKTLCYHRRYLGEKELIKGYDNMLKQVEQGKLTWTDEMSEKLHQHLDYQANVITRDKMLAQQETGFTKVERGKASGNGRNNTDGKEKAFYCLEYNLGTCNFKGSHEGRLGTRRITKQHICRKCHREGEIKNHRETDEACNKRT